MTGKGHPAGEVDQFRDLVEQVVDAHAARSRKRRAGRDVGHGPIAYVAAILTSMSTPPTPVPPPRREGRRFAIPTPADLRHPGSRRRPTSPEDVAEPTSATADEAVVESDATPSPQAVSADPDTDGASPVPIGSDEPAPAAAADEAPAPASPAATESPGATSSGAQAPPTPAAPDTPAPGTGGPTPGTMPRRRPPAGAAVPEPVVAAVPAPPADGTDAELSGSHPAADEPPDDSGDGARRLFPNPATLMAAGRGVRKVRPGGLRGRRLPKVEETSAGGVVLDLSSDPPAVALIARHDRRSRLLWSLPKGHVEEGETPEQAALREVFEETGLVGRIVAPLGVIDFWFVVEDKRIHKTVHHYVIEAVGGELSDEDVEVEAVEWIPFHQVVRKLAYGDERRLVEKVPQIVPGVK